MEIKDAFGRLEFNTGKLGHHAKPAAAVAELKGKVSVGLVNAVKQKLKKLRGRKAMTSNGLDLQALIAAKALAEKVGELDKAKAALDALAKLA